MALFSFFDHSLFSLTLLFSVYQFSLSVIDFEFYIVMHICTFAMWLCVKHSPEKIKSLYG